MAVDAFLNLSSAQTVTATAVSTNTVDLSTNRDIGAANEDTGIQLQITVDQTVTAAGAATVTFQVISSAAANLSSPTVLIQTDAIGKAELPAGRKPIIIPLSRSQLISAQQLGQRYIGLQYTIGTGPLTAGQFTVYGVLNGQDVGKNYPSGFSVT